METQSVRVRLLFEDRSLLSESQRSEGMNRSWLLVEPLHHRKISDLCNHLLQYFNLRRSCPNGIHLYMEGFVLPPSESTRILKDKEIICVKRKGMALTEAIEAADACNLLDEAEVNRNGHVDNGMLLLANEEFDKETGEYQSESEEAEEEQLEDEPSPIETLSKKRKASTKHWSSKNKKHRSVVMNDVKDEIATEEDNINNDECLPMKIISKKIKPTKEKGSAETIIVKAKSPPKVKRKKKHLLGVVSCAKDDVATDEIDDVSNGESLPRKMISKKKNKPNEETNKGNAEINDEKVKSPSNVKRSERLQDNVEGVEQASTPLDGAKKVPSRSARRKKAKRKWRRELAKISQTLDAHPEPEVSKADNKEANDHPKGSQQKQDQLPTKLVHKNTIKQEERNCNGDVDTVLVPCVVRPGHIRFEPLDEDEDVRPTDVPEVAFQWNGITSKKKGQKWGLEKSSTFRRDDSQKASTEPSTMLSADREVPVIDINDFDKLPLCTSPKEGDVIAYRLLELTSWTPALSSFRVGKISYYDADNIVLMPMPEYPIVLDKMDEDGPDNSLYKEDGTLEIKFEALVDVRTVKQGNSDAMKAVNNRVNQTPQGDDKNTASNLISSSHNNNNNNNNNNNKENLSKDPSSVVANKEGNTWDELNEVLSAKKAQLLEMKEEMKKDSGWNRWSYRALRGSALGPTMALLRSKNDV